MKVIRNSVIPFKGFVAINLFGVVFVRNDIHPPHNFNQRELDKVLMHEYIHTRQMRELLYIPFYLWYVLEWLIRLAIYRNTREAYRNISFEREAYDKQAHFDYIIYDERKPYAFIKYFLKKG